MRAALMSSMRLATHDEEAWFAQPEDVIALTDFVPPPRSQRMIYALAAAFAVTLVIAMLAI
jgi:hypothetical protein